MSTGGAASLTQAGRTALVLGLLDSSWRAREAGNRDESRRLIDRALEVDAMVVQAIRGGIMIGQVPDPGSDPHAWAAYVQAATDQAATEG